MMYDNIVFHVFEHGSNNESDKKGEVSLSIYLIMMSDKKGELCLVL